MYYVVGVEVCLEIDSKHVARLSILFHILCSRILIKCSFQVDIIPILQFEAQTCDLKP